MDYSGSERLSSRTRKSAITASRYRYAPGSGQPFINTTSENAFLAIFQLRDHPEHRFWIDGREVPAPFAPKGGLHILDLNAPLSAEHVETVDALHIEIPRAAIDDLAADAGVTSPLELTAPVAWATPDPIIPHLEALVLAALNPAGPHSTLSVDHLLHLIGEHIIRTYGGVRAAVRQQGGLAPWQEMRAKDLIATNLFKSMSLEDIARECGLSTAYFSRAFKISAGMTPHEWLQARRIDLAQDLLRRPCMSLAEVAIACGFADQSHFTRMFKRVIGETPGVWRGIRGPEVMSMSPASSLGII